MVTHGERGGGVVVDIGGVGNVTCVWATASFESVLDYRRLWPYADHLMISLAFPRNPDVIGFIP